MTSTYDVIVIGLGAMGSAACFHLARRGISVLGLEQFSIPHSLGSSHGESRMIRLCYYEHPDYVPLLKRAYQLWDELDQLTGQQHLHRTGGLYMGPADCGFIVGTLDAAQRHRLPHKKLLHHDLAQQYPQSHLPNDHIGVFEPEAGFLLPEKVVASHTELALQHGAHLHAHEAVIDWSAAANSVQVRTDRSSYSAKHLVICGGAWSDHLLADLGVPLVVTRQSLDWVWPKKPAQFQMGTIPVWAINHPDGSIHYGFPMLPRDLSNRPGFKIAHHFKGEPTTPQSIDRIPNARDEADFRHILKQFIPDADGPLLSMAICMYTNSPDSHFIIDHHPNHERVTVACGFSGHGFKFASVVGEILADLALQGRTEHPIAFLGLNRF